MRELLSLQKSHACVEKMLSLHARHYGICSRFIGPFGIHRSQHAILMRLSQGEKIVSQKELADEFGVTPAAIVSSLHKLERKGYVARVESSEDRRNNEVSITDAGKAIVAESRLIFSGIDRIMMRGVTERESEILHHILDKISRNLEEIERGKLDPKDYGSANTEEIIFETLV